MMDKQLWHETPGVLVETDASGSLGFGAICDRRGQTTTQLLDMVSSGAKAGSFFSLSNVQRESRWFRYWSLKLPTSLAYVLSLFAMDRRLDRDIHHH